MASYRNCCYGSFQTVSNDDKKGSEKVPSPNFLSNVRRLLSNGMLGRAAMKYIAWSLEVNFTVHDLSDKLITC